MWRTACLVFADMVVTQKAPPAKLILIAYDFVCKQAPEHNIKFLFVGRGMEKPLVSYDGEMLRRGDIIEGNKREAYI